MVHRLGMLTCLFVPALLFVTRCNGSGNTAAASLMAADGSGLPDVDDGGASNTPYGGAWQALAQPPPVYGNEPALLTDGTVMVHSTGTSDWWRLAPDITGSYVNGTWSQLSPMPSGYAPLYFGEAVLPSGSLVVVGGEYNRGTDAWTALGAIYDPVKDAWTPLMPPASWAVGAFGIGDTPTVVLPSGVLMIGSVGTNNQALLDPRTLTFTLTGAGKYDDNEEEGWTLLPNGKVLTVDVSGAPRTEVYDPTTGSWSSAGNTPVAVADKVVGEVGPAVLMPNGSVFATGATPHNALYQASGGTWTQGPDFPIIDGGQVVIADGPAALLTNGHVLCAASPSGTGTPPVTFLEFDGTNLTPLPATANASSEPAFLVMLIPLPSGQVMAFDGSLDVEVFTPNGTPDPSWAPTVTNAPSTVARGSTNIIQGTQFNGLSQACAYGDDFQCATNYPLVRITNNATNHVFYARTHDHSAMGVATGAAPVSTLFDVGANVETGPSTLVVVANGIASMPVAVTVQ
jgi:hypothetical protein